MRCGSGVCREPIDRCTSCVARELFGDLEAGVAAADDEHRPGGHVVRRAVLGAVELHDVRVQLRGDRRASRGTWNGPVAITTWSAS